MEKPDFIIAGESRCGSTSLFECLIKHPNIDPPRMDSPDHYQYKGSKLHLRQKEIRFFDRYWDKGIQWYRSLFEGKQVCGDASATYLFNYQALKRIQSVLPKIKIIILLRNPVDRLNSHFHHMQKIDANFKSKYQNLSDFFQNHSKDHQHLIERGIYYNSINNLLELFPLNQILILQSENLFSNNQESIHNILQFLEVGQIKLQYDAFRSSDPAPIPAELNSTIREFYRPWNEKLNSIIGLGKNWNQDL